ncbi:polysaccharide deacetylase family protein [Candidatus Hakubella thermalkaliphila]|uniref:4-alpha-glucanotransferase n=1 Tax=Candidatus Hakubella thermalkaliphila TaxID=2754717 RepID=A0A6V8NZ68_9ACTN|nr:polysaccharide deacetylase family protein [Candidatus Hakubella thermalkaliphila]GFP25507.1 hypothetical protein HKBW3S25_00987 [Candidatus Hakubella thermalkaliphila]GFP27369.1 4-alpha-glucanotransferase [Candidatus Hakubella thermalkaliphila]
MKLKLVCLWHLYQPSVGLEMGWAQENAWECYRIIPKIYAAHPRMKAAINIQGVLIEQLLAYDPSVIEPYKALIHNGQFEIVCSAYYHPLLPLLPPEDMAEQIDMDMAAIEDTFGVKPVGFRPPELAWSSILIPILAERGIQWSIIDSSTLKLARKKMPALTDLEESSTELLPYSLEDPSVDLADRDEAFYQTYVSRVAEHRVNLLIRDHQLSRLFEEPSGCLTGVVKPKRLVAALKNLHHRLRGGIVVISADGEYIGGQGDSSRVVHFEEILSEMEDLDFVESVTPAELFDRVPARKEIFVPAGTQMGNFDRWTASAEDKIFIQQLNHLRRELEHVGLYARITGKADESAIRDLLGRVRRLILMLQSNSWLTWHYEPAQLRIRGYEYMLETRSLLNSLKELVYEREATLS